jgi:hypothetical protein
MLILFTIVFKISYDRSIIGTKMGTCEEYKRCGRADTQISTKARRGRT